MLFYEYEMRIDPSIGVLLIWKNTYFKTGYTSFFPPFSLPRTFKQIKASFKGLNNLEKIETKLYVDFGTFINT